LFDFKNGSPKWVLIQSVFIVGVSAFIAVASLVAIYITRALTDGLCASVFQNPYFLQICNSTQGMTHLW